jgi:hypothetical protein
MLIPGDRYPEFDFWWYFPDHLGDLDVDGGTISK